MLSVLINEVAFVNGLGIALTFGLVAKDVVLFIDGFGMTLAVDFTVPTIEVLFEKGLGGVPVTLTS